MDTPSEIYKKCSVRINAFVAGVEFESTGFLYVTSVNSQFDYVLTTKHTFKNDAEDEHVILEDITKVEVSFYENKKFTLLERFSKNKYRERIIFTDKDLAILLVEKSNVYQFPIIKVSDIGNVNCISYSIINKSNTRLYPLNYERVDSKEQLYQLNKFGKKEDLHGASGSGIISTDIPILQGIVMRLPSEEFNENIVDAVDITFNEINHLLSKHKLETLCMDVVNNKRRIVKDDTVIDIDNAKINNVSLNLELAIKHVKVDSKDDWFHDPLSFVDLSNYDFLFDYFGDNLKGKQYETISTETFFLPKKSYTLRKAMVISYPDRIFYAALVQVLGLSIDNCIKPFVYSARFNKLHTGGLIISGVEQWKKMQYKIEERSKDFKYIIEIDVLNFYDNIDINLLCEKVTSIAKTDNERNASIELKKALKIFSKKSNTSIPQNSDASSLLATFYLSELDVFMCHLVPEYYRFMDDIKIFCNDKFEARRILRLLEMELRNLKLSINGQKTKIIDLKPNDVENKLEITNAYQSFFDLERSTLSRLANSSNQGIINEAFHLAIKIILEKIKEDSEGRLKDERTLSLALTTIKKCYAKGVTIDEKSKFQNLFSEAFNLLIEKPWITPQLCSLIGILDKESIPKEFWVKIEQIVLKDSYNIYSWQCYHLWLLFAKHKIKSVNLSQFASKLLKSNDEINKPVVAGLMIYMGSIDINYRRIILSKYKEGFARGHFQERITLIVLRGFETEDIFNKRSPHEAIHKSLHKYKNKELVYIAGEQDNEELEIELQQIYSL
ncbi:RNA-directed DNA polymerase [Aquimarina aquimarini]|uniref:RNA-directed DNA polymerase n=1 Tax=Aquimarina aquimarini TaxID=1191734 RepID=UPI000D54E464|nr:RNA-directed DNA polymerase [Aquimarina aquimarini]